MGARMGFRVGVGEPGAPATATAARRPLLLLEARNDGASKSMVRSPCIIAVGVATASVPSARVGRHSKGLAVSCPLERAPETTTTGRRQRTDVLKWTSWFGRGLCKLAAVLI